MQVLNWVGKAPEPENLTPRARDEGLHAFCAQHACFGAPYHRGIGTLDAERGASPSHPGPQENQILPPTRESISAASGNQRATSAGSVIA